MWVLYRPMRADISIHAPSRERPIETMQSNMTHDISIHAPSRERLSILPVLTLSYKHFNPRSLAGATEAG